MHDQFLLAALDQAWFGRGMCAPNPSVGAVAVQDGKIIAQSWHRGAGTPHAEVLLLEKLPKQSSNVTIYVTLEPCNHWGKTPPCVDAIIQHGVKQVVYGYSDPNPVVSANNTPSLLANQGIHVLHYPMLEIERFYESYRYWTKTNMPWVTAKIAQSFDGKIAGVLGKRTSLSNSLCNHFTHHQRLHSDIILTTAQTINMDDPKLNARLESETIAKPVAILDSQLKLNSNAAIHSTARYKHIYYDARYPSPSMQSNTSFHPITVSDSGEIDLYAVLHHLGELGYHDVWVEAGARLFNALHKRKLVHRTYIYLVPILLGEAAFNAYQNENIFLKNGYALSWHVMGDNMIAQFDWQESLCSQD